MRPRGHTVATSSTRSPPTGTSGSAEMRDRPGTTSSLNVGLVPQCGRPPGGHAPSSQGDFEKEEATPVVPAFLRETKVGQMVSLSALGVEGRRRGGPLRIHLPDVFSFVLSRTSRFSGGHPTITKGRHMGGGTRTGGVENMVMYKKKN